MEEALQILDGEGGGVLASVFGGAGDVGEEGDIGQAAEGRVLGQGLGFVDIEANLEVGSAVAGDTDEGGFVDDGASANVDEGAAGADRAEEFFGYDVVILFCVRGEFDDDVMSPWNLPPKDLASQMIPESKKPFPLSNSFSKRAPRLFFAVTLAGQRGNPSKSTRSVQ